LKQSVVQSEEFTAGVPVSGPTIKTSGASGSVAVALIGAFFNNV
jgi:hypothetical protein